MKKVCAMILAVILVLGLSVPAFAAGSPEGVSMYKVYVINGQGAKTEKYEVPVGDELELKANPDKGDFDKWEFYKADGTKAVAGVDYVIVSGSATSEKITIRPMANIIVTGNYDGIKTSFELDNNEPNSPQTGDTTVVMLASVMVLALAGAVIAKKQLAK